MMKSEINGEKEKKQFLAYKQKPTMMYIIFDNENNQVLKRGNFV